MKIKLFPLSLLLIGAIGNLMADITVTLPQECNLKSMAYYCAPIKQYAEAKSRADRGIVTDSVSFDNHKAVIPIPSEANGYMYGLNLKDHNITLYAVPGENLQVSVTSCNPFNYTLKGSSLLEGMDQLNQLEKPLMERAMALNSSGNTDPEEMDKISQQYINLQNEFFDNNPEGVAAPVALMNLEGEDFIIKFESNKAALANSILFPLLSQQYEREKKNIEMEKKQQALQSGQVDAPGFTLKDLEGKEISLSDFKGKWVILDFWGSWCPWCIKGFPELKEAYEKYSGKLEIIGIDCKESEDEWKAGVKKYQLPWVNVYNPEGTDILSEYGVQGFPTKAIIDPEGKIRNITVGHNPEFFVVLSELLGQ